MTKSTAVSRKGAKTRRSTTHVPRPFLKWVGGKGQLLDELMARVELAGEFGNYHEPFVGAGALFFGLHQAGILKGRRVLLSDGNGELVNAWRCVRDSVDLLLDVLAGHQARHSKDYFLAIRAESPVEAVAQAARTIYLNRTCFNGLYRVNSRGKFNVAFGDYNNPLICDEENLRAVSSALAGVELAERFFQELCFGDHSQHVTAGDLVYLDPPYHGGFTSYTPEGFSDGAQRYLAWVFEELSLRGVKVLASNSATDFIRDLYEWQDVKGLVIEEVSATRAVNRDGGGRGAVGEFLIRPAVIRK